MANSYNLEFTLTLQGCYATAMVFRPYFGVRMFFHYYFVDLKSIEQLHFNYIIKIM